MKISKLQKLLNKAVVCTSRKEAQKILKKAQKLHYKPDSYDHQRSL